MAVVRKVGKKGWHGGIGRDADSWLAHKGRWGKEMRDL